MLIGISGTPCSGKSTLIKYLTDNNFTLLTTDPAITNKNFGSYTYFPTDESLLSHSLQNFSASHVVLLTPNILSHVSKRPFFLHISIDAPISIRYSRHIKTYPNNTVSQFIELNDQTYVTDTKLQRDAQIQLINEKDSVAQFFSGLDDLNLKNEERLRPSWDKYFMNLANLAAMRCNCMKRRVGAVVVRENRVVATGYNGTARGLKNCKDGGCERCNSGDGSGVNLGLCFCLHAEENALLECGRERVFGGKLYCNTCPCLTCAIKIVQCGIEEVVYDQSYSMDEVSKQVLCEGGVKLRQYVPTKEGVIVI